MNFVVIKGKWIFLGVLAFVIAFGGWYVVNKGPIPTTGKVAQAEEYVVNMIVGEFKTKTEDGREIEAYRFDPGTIVVPKGQEITIKIFGVNGAEHPFVIEGTDITGIVKKGEETVIKTTFSKPGVYRIICTTHLHGDHVPMIGYIHVH